MMLDITERKQAEIERERLLQVVERWAAEMDATISAIADGVLIFSPTLEIVRCNTAATALFGAPKAQIETTLRDWLTRVQLQTPEGQLIPFDETAAYQAATQGITTHGKIKRFTRDTGELCYVAVSTAPIRTPVGDQIGAVATFADITPLRELQQRQEDLLHLVSHDLRIPLTVIQGYMDCVKMALRKHQLENDLHVYTSTIDRNVARMTVMIQDLVDMALLEGQHFTLACASVSLQAYLPEFLAQLRDILPVHRFSLEIAPDVPPVQADINRLERIILNLLTNACKYSPADTPVRLQASRLEDEVVFTVIDQGHGIAPDKLPHIFERFYRTRERQAEGIGLGLYITKLLVEAHGGRLWVESQVGEGSTFTFTMPVVQESLDALSNVCHQYLPLVSEDAIR